MTDELETLFNDIKDVLAKHSDDMKVTDEYLDSKAKIKKPAYHLYGKKDVSLFNKRPQPTHLAGVIKQKNYVSFYFSPVYSHRDEFIEKIDTELKKTMKGKSCFNIRKASPEILKEIEKTLTLGKEKYKEIGWL